MPPILYRLFQLEEIIHIFRKHPEAKVLSKRTQTVARIVGVLYLLILATTFIGGMFLIEDSGSMPKIALAGIMTLLVAVGVGLPLLLVLGYIDRKSNFNKVTTEMMYAGKPKNYDPFLIYLDQYGFIAVLVPMLVAIFLTMQFNITLVLAFSFGIYFFIRAIIALLKKRDYTRWFYQGQWFEGKEAIQMAVIWFVLAAISFGYGIWRG
jgi:hypothetical protein